MVRREISLIAHADHPIAAPLDDDAVRALLDRALRPGDERLLDLGCGEGAWVVRALTGRPGLRAEGVDLDAGTVARARAAAAAAGLADRAAFHVGDAREFASAEVFDVVLSVGAAHAFGGLLPTLDAAGRLLAPGGRVIVGDGFWERPPARAVLDLGFEAGGYQDLATTVDRVTAAGWVPVYGHVSSAREFDDYEWSWTGTLTRWALDHPDHPDAAEALDTAARHRTEWLRGFRGTLGFVTLCLRRVPD